MTQDAQAGAEQSFPGPQVPRWRKAALPILALVVCLLFFVGRSVTSLTQECATWDETLLFGVGKYLLQQHRWDLPAAALHPPLSFYLNSIPFLFSDIDPHLWISDSPENLPAAIRRGRLLLSSPANQGDRLLTQSRLMMVSLAVLLGCFVYAWSYSLYGSWSALLALILYTFCPNILANARLITPDISVTTFFFITVYFLWRFLETNQRTAAILGGGALGLALLSKFTGVLLLPVCIALGALHWSIRKKPDLRGCVLFVLIGILVLWLGYGMDLRPYLAGIEYQRAHASFGHAAFLMGEYSTSGWWYYFIVAFVLKTPIAGMLLLAISLFRLLRRGWRDVRIGEAFLLIPAAVVFTFFSVNHQSIGLRYVLPIYPFLYVVASEVAGTVTSKSTWRIGLIGIFVLWYMGASLSIHPHYLAYFNEFAGGPSNGYKYLVDSNLDWGQDLKGLGRYMEEHAIPKISLSYFGTDTPQRYGIAYTWLPSYQLENPNPRIFELAPGGWLAISATNLQGVYFPNKRLFASLKNHPPEATIGYSIFVYHFDHSPPMPLKQTPP